MDSREEEIVESMEWYGDDTIKALAKKFRNATRSEINRLKVTFRAEWEKYEGMSQE